VDPGIADVVPARHAADVGPRRVGGVPAPAVRRADQRSSRMNADSPTSTKRW
jgi:hypothetical protein